MIIYKKVIQVDFICTNHMRMDHLSPSSHSELSELSIDVVYEVRSLWCESLGDLIVDKACVYASDVLFLRWFDGMPGNVQKGGIMTLPVEISYSSKVLDREKKLELILGS